LGFLQKRKREVVVVLVLDALVHLQGVGLVHVVDGQDQDRGGVPEIGDVLVQDQGDQGPGPNAHVHDHEIRRDGPEALGVVAKVIHGHGLIAGDVQDLNQGDPILNQNPAQRAMRNQGIKRMIKKKKRMTKRIRKMTGKKKRRMRKKMTRRRKTPRERLLKRKVMQKGGWKKPVLKMNLPRAVQPQLLKGRKTVSRIRRRIKI